MFKFIVAAILAAAVVANVVTLTPDNYDSVVSDPTKNVFVKYYAPWCGHCTRMAPAWAELASNNKDKDDLVIAECDASAHAEIASKNGIRGFPTIKFYPKDNKAGVPYSGARDLAAFQNFIGQHAQ